MKNPIESPVNVSAAIAFPAILDILEEALFLFDTCFRMAWHNKACDALYYSATGTHINKHFDFNELLTEEQQLVFADNLRQVLKGEKMHFEWNYQKKSVSRWVSVSLYPYRTADGVVAGICGSMRDITERKNADYLIRTNEKKYRTLVNSLSEGVILQTPGRKMLTANQSAVQILGVTLEELVKKGFPLPEWEMVDKNEKPVSCDNFFCRKNGRISPVKDKALGIRRGNSIQWLKLNMAGVSDAPNGEPYAIAISFEDITEKKMTSRELRVLSMVAKETLNAVLILKPAGEAVWMNEGFTRLTGYSREEIVGTVSREMLSGPGTDDITQQEMTHSRRNGLPFQKEQVMYTKDGVKKRVRVDGQPMRDENGELSMFFVIVTDITEQRRMEEERLQNQLNQQKEITRVMMQAQEAERDNLGRELHDNINQLLAATALQLSYCSSNYKQARPVIEDCRKNVMMAIDEIRHLSHKMVMPYFSVSNLSCELNWLIAHYKHTPLHIQLDTSGWKDADVQPAIKETLFRIAQEQMGNIHKHAQASKVSMHISTGEETAQLSICDDGIGFDTSQEKKGIGITNIINRAEAYNGTSHFTSAPGKGCRLLVTIPFKDQSGAGYSPIR